LFYIKEVIRDWAFTEEIERYAVVWVFFIGLDWRRKEYWLEFLRRIFCLRSDVRCGVSDRDEQDMA